MRIPINHRGYELQKIDRRNNTTVADEKRIWIAIYYHSQDEFEPDINGYGTTPEEAVDRAIELIDRQSSTFHAPKPFNGEAIENYANRLAQDFEAWANKRLP